MSSYIRAEMKREPKTEKKKSAAKPHPFAKFIPTKQADRIADFDAPEEKRQRKKFNDDFAPSEKQKRYAASPSKRTEKKFDAPPIRKSENSRKPSLSKTEFAETKPNKRSAKPTTALETKIRKRIDKLDEHNKLLEEQAAKEKSESFRLNKFLAHAGIASRRKADELIAAGRVKVNGVVVKEMGYRLKEEDKVTYDGKRITPEQKVYILINKPKDCITTTNDERDRRTVLDLIQSAYAQIKSLTKPRLFPVGRLDRNTTGVLLITNDGELTQNLTHPSREIKKIYQVTLDKKVKQEDMERIQHGVVLEDGIAEVNEVAYVNAKNKAEVGIEIHSGKNRIVRRIFESLGYEVVKLDRVYFGGLTKKDIPRGKWRFLTEPEVIRLKHFKI
ncbi:MAG: pseudouridine synthase [Chitinophagales bacterium]